MRSIVTLLFGLVLLSSLNGQTKTDSLVLIYEQIQGSSISEVKRLNEIAKSNAASYPSLANQFAKKALKKSKEIDYLEGEGNAYLNIATVNRTRSDLTKALENGFRSFRIFEQLLDSVKMASASNAIGVYYKDLDMPDSCLKYLNKSLELNKTDIKARGTTLNNIGSIYLDIEQLDSAEKYYNKSLDIREEIKDLYGLGITYGNLGIISLQKKNDPEEAKYYYEKSLMIKKTNGDFFQIAFTYINLGNLHRNIGKYDEARKYYQTAVDYADSAEAKGVMSSAYVRWARSERRAGNTELADKYDKLSNELYIDVLEERQKSEMEQLQATYNLERKEQELLINEQKVFLLEKDQRILVIQLVAALSIAAFLFALFFWYRTKTKKDREIQESKAARLKSELENKNSELSSFTLNFIQKQEMMENLSQITKELKKKAVSEIVKAKIRELEKVVSAQQRNDKEWENFRIYFEKVHTDFFKRLQADFEGLTITDLRLAALIKLNLSIKETASVLGIAPGSVKTSRYRLRTKLGLKHDESLLDFFAPYSN